MAKAQEFEKVLEQSDMSAASFESHIKSPLEKAQHFLHSSQAAVPLIVLILSIAVFGILVGGKFFNAFSLTLILQQVAIVGIVGAAQTLVILTAGIDLSVGAVMVLSSVVMGQFTFRYGIPVPISILCGLACGALCGFINGWLIAKMKLPPFIVTLGTWKIIKATSASSIQPTRRSAKPTISAAGPAAAVVRHQLQIRRGGHYPRRAADGRDLVVFLWYILNYTAWGRHLYAVGDDPEAAQLTGIRVDRMLIAVYALSGLICGYAGLGADRADRL